MPNETPLISLCAIVGNVETYIERFLRSFAPLVDQIVMVRAIGNQEPDKTFEIAKSLTDLPQLITFEYTNHRDHKEWPHLDNFAAARNLSFQVASGKYLFWADTDDVFGNGNEEETRQMIAEVRKHAEDGTFPIYAYTYNIFGRGLKIHRERMVLRGLCGWRFPVHECMDPPEGTMAGKDEFITITHMPESTKTGSNDRNLRILESIPEEKMEPGLWYHLHGEYVFRKDEAKAVWSAKKALDWKAKDRPSLGRPERYEIFMNLGKMVGLDRGAAATLNDLAVAEDYFLQAFKTDPRRREALGLLTCNRIDAGQPDHALAYAHAMMGLPRPDVTSWNDRGAAYEWLGVDIYTQALRVNGKYESADRYRFEVLKDASKTRPIITLIHATRGRPRQASMARKIWLELAERPDAIEHIFVLDTDDKESQALRRLHNIIIEPGGGCVAAWNAGAFGAYGNVFIQMSDDWVPPARWDTLILEKFGKSIDEPRVLAVSDGHRKDDLLCMAICTRAYYQRDFFLFHPWFTGVYSDNYFTFMAHQRKAVIDGTDLVFNHNHPFFQKDGAKEIDETYARQNSTEAYETGKAVYRELLKRRDWSTVPGYCNYWTFYQSVAKMLKDGDTVAEIGVWMGRSIIMLAQECKRLGKKVKLYAVDNFKGESNQSEHADTIKILAANATTLREEFQKNIERCEVADMIEVLDGDSHRVANVVPTGSLTFCFIDAAHDEQSVKRDIDAWLPKLKKSCAIAGHDSQHKPVIDAVKSRFAADAFQVLGPVWIAKKT